MASNKLIVINIASDLGSMIKGKSLAPGAFQDIGFIKKLQELGYDAKEKDALSSGPQVWTSEADFGSNGVRNEEASVQVNHDVKKSVSEALNDGDAPPFQIIVGGGCDVAPAIMSAYWKRLSSERIGLMYVDADADLTVPSEPSSSGNLASMTMTHLCMRHGSLESQKPFTRPDGSGVVDPSNTVIFGLNSAAPGNTPSQLGYLFDEGYRVFTSASIAKDPEGQAKKAMDWLGSRVDHIIVHLDVDAIDATRFPLANVPQRTGADFLKIMAAMKVFLSNSQVCGLVIAEVNPDHDPGLKMTTRLADELTKGLKERLGKS